MWLPLVTRRASSRCWMLSIRVLNLLRWTAVQACQKACRNSSTMEVGSSMPRVQTPIWSQTCSLGCMSGLRADQSMTSISCCVKKAVVSRAVWGVPLSWTYTKFRPKTLSPWDAYYRKEAWCSVGGWGFHPAPPVHSSHHENSTPYHDWGLPTMG